MSKTMRVVVVALGLIFVTLFVVACGPPKTLVETITEAELNEEVAEDGFAVDLQPGKIVMTGEVEGMNLVIEILARAEAGALVMELAKVEVNGESMPLEMFAGADLDSDLTEIIYSENEDYEVTTIEITDTEIIVTSTLK